MVDETGPYAEFCRICMQYLVDSVCPILSLFVLCGFETKVVIYSRSARASGGFSEDSKDAGKETASIEAGTGIKGYSSGVFGWERRQNGAAAKKAGAAVCFSENNSIFVSWGNRRTAVIFGRIVRIERVEVEPLRSAKRMDFAIGLQGVWVHIASAVAARRFGRVRSRSPAAAVWVPGRTELRPKAANRSDEI